MICKCGNEFETPFCPECGRPMTEPLAELLTHCQVTARAKLRERLRAEESAKAYSDIHDSASPPEASLKSRSIEGFWIKRRLDSLEKTIEKWQRWTDALRELMAERKSEK